MIIHATCVAIKQKGVLLCGKPGVGKSSLALHLMDRGALLVADDQTCLSLEEEHLIASPPPSLRGMLEVRGVSLFSFPYQETVPIALCVEFFEEGKNERLPSPLFTTYGGIKVPLLKLEKNDTLGPLKIELKLGYSSLKGQEVLL